MPPTAIKTADSKGRVTLGGLFVGRPVIIERISETEVSVKLARVIPESEMWLWENTAARDSVLRGLEQAKRREFVKGPDLDADDTLAAMMLDED
jgi:hypothetical protein